MDASSTFSLSLENTQPVNAYGDVESTKLYEDEHFFVFLDILPANHGHTLIIPKKHFADIGDVPDGVLGRVLPLAKKVSKALMDTLKAQGTNIIQNNGKAAGQEVNHYHVHVIPRFEDDKHKLNWTPKEYQEGELKEYAEKIKQAL